MCTELNFVVGSLAEKCPKQGNANEVEDFYPNAHLRARKSANALPR